ncbi:hypothetical protein [Terrarubrum flagellatum]|uniref:hypothetical protein n=1 Tax=Terrirubrum flagellatum TaxID=2895980 RepID=UPI00314557E2
MARRFLAGLALTLLALPIASESRAQNSPGSCISRFRFVPNGVTVVSGSTFRNRPCALPLGSNSSIRDYRLLVRPANGILGAAGEVGGRYQTAYQPNPGFVGTDRFEVEIVYAARPRAPEMTTRIQATIYVVP